MKSWRFGERFHREVINVNVAGARVEKWRGGREVPEVATHRVAITAGGRTDGGDRFSCVPID